MKIIHCADVHLDSAMNTSLQKEQIKERRQELIMTFKKMVEYASDNGVEAVLIAGDLFDTRTVSATAFREVDGVIRKYPEITFLYLQGNHDFGSFTERMDVIPENLKLFTENWSSYVIEGRDGTKVTVSGVELTEGNCQNIYSELALPIDDVNIVMLHGQITEYGADKKAQSISLRDLANRGIDYLALGHVHERAEGKLDTRGKYVYCGCLEGRGFDECGDHGFEMLEILPGSRNVTHEFIPFARRRIHAFSVDVSGCTGTHEMQDRIEAALAASGIAGGDMVRVEMTGELELDCEKNVGFLQQQFADRYYVFRLKDKTKFAINPAEYANMKSLKGEFVRLVLADDGLSEDDKNRIIRYGIQFLKGEAEVE